MSQIDPASQQQRLQTASGCEADGTSFDDLVLQYFQNKKPEGSLNDILADIKALAPDKKLSLQELNTAVLIADGEMRNDEAYKDYTDSTLDKLTSQLLGVNMFYNTMLYKGFTKNDDDSSL